MQNFTFQAQVDALQKACTNRHFLILKWKKCIYHLSGNCAESRMRTSIAPQHDFQDCMALAACRKFRGPCSGIGVVPTRHPMHVCSGAI